MTNIATKTMTAGALMRKPGSRRFQTIRARDASVIVGLHSSSSGGGGVGGASRKLAPPEWWISGSLRTRRPWPRAWRRRIRR